MSHADQWRCAMNASFRVDPGLAMEMSRAIGTEKDLFTLFSIALNQTTAMDLRRLAVNKLDDLNKDVLGYIRTEAQPEVLDGISRSGLFPATYRIFASAAARDRKEKIMSMKIEDYKPAYPELLPALTDEVFESLKKDIELRGVKVPIEVDIATNEIVDGYHRHKAAVELGIVDNIPITKRQFGSEIERKLHALALNIHRRQLSPSQKAAYAVEVLSLFEKHAKERQLAALKNGAKLVKEKIPERENGQARDHAAKALDVNPRYVSDAKKILNQDPATFEQIKSGEKTISEVKAELTTSNGNGAKWTPKAAIKRIDAAIRAETREASGDDFVAIGEWLAERGNLMKNTRTIGDGFVTISEMCPETAE
jgi:ParB-like nuclease domain